MTNDPPALVDDKGNPIQSATTSWLASITALAASMLGRTSEKQDVSAQDVFSSTWKHLIAQTDGSLMDMLAVTAGLSFMFEELIRKRSSDPRRDEAIRQAKSEGRKLGRKCFDVLKESL